MLENKIRLEYLKRKVSTQEVRKVTNEEKHWKLNKKI